MAEATEDLPDPGLFSDSEDDSAPNFLNLGFLASTKQGSTIPKRGLKDFEPNTTLLQRDTLTASRSARQDALCFTRSHNPNAAGMGGKTVIGVYDPGSGLTTIPKARAKGTLWRTMGKAVSDGGQQLLPEEALFALEAGRLDVRYPLVEESCIPFVPNDDEQKFMTDDGETAEEGKGEAQGNDNDSAFGMTMSLQGAYAAYVGEEENRGGFLTLERYLTYAALKRAGYIVLRAAEGWGRTTEDSMSQSKERNGFDAVFTPPQKPNTMSTGTSFFSSLYRILFPRYQDSREAVRSRQRRGPLVTPGLYRSYDEIFRLLHIIPSHYSVTYAESSASAFHLPDVLKGEEVGDRTPFTTAYNVYKPHPQFRKSAPGPPAFRICVLSAREDAVPTLSKLSSLMEEQPTTPPSGAHSEPGSGSVGNLYGRLKHGRRNVIFAVVDEGVVSYIRVADAAFSQEMLYEKVGKSSGKPKKGGGGTKRGRGSGRGRGGR